MTLVMNNVQSNFVIMTSDSAYITNEYENGQVVRRIPKVSDKKGFKASQLSNKVLYSVTGIQEIYDLVMEKLNFKIKPGDDLKRCSEITKSVINELIENNPEFIRMSVLGGPTGFTLVGFYTSGQSGRVTIDIREGQIFFDELRDFQGWGMGIPGDMKPIGSHIFDTGGLDCLNNLENTSMTMLNIHALVSYVNSDGVSSDCTFYVIQKVKKKNKFKYDFKTITMDTLEMHQSFPGKEEVEAFLYQ